MVLLKAMISDPTRSWIGQPQSAADYANGTRLFAYRALHSELNCRELTLALNDIDAVAKAFRTPVAGVKAAQANRVLALNAEVDGELRSEYARRCRT